MDLEPLPMKSRRLDRHHLVKPTAHHISRLSFEKTTHNICPSCGKADLTVYFRSGSRSGVGAYCDACGMTGFFARDGFFRLGRIAPHLFPDRARSRVSGG